jgi:CRISPR-associated protein Csm1
MTDEHELKTEVWQAALAGLLHDIGKFAQRADVGKREATNQQSLDEVKYEHALHSDSVVQEYVPQPWRGQITGPRRHHRPQAVQDYQVQLADWLSSGERDEDEDNRVPYLLSVFARLAGHQARDYLPLTRLDPAQGNIFPTMGEPGNWRTEYRDQYKALWDQFTSACKQLPTNDPVAYLESLYSLLQEFTWCIPSAYYNNVPDVSLFDHTRMTAALAACMAIDGRDSAWCQRVAGELGTTRTGDAVCLLVGGDISGVQSFLYTLASSGAAKSLRARSFYLQLLTEVVAQYILDELGLPITNLLYAGGGNFFILAGSTQEKELARLRREVSQKLLVAHDGGLHLALAYVPVRANEFSRGEFHAVWDQLHQRLAVSKRRPLADLDAVQFAQQVGAAHGEGGDAEQVCSVCGRESLGRLQSDEKDETVRKCGFCASLEKLGAQLSRATHLVWLKSSARESVSQEPADWWRAMMAFGINVYAINASELPGRGVYIDQWPDSLQMIRVNRLQPIARHEERLVRELTRGVPIVQAYRPFAQLAPFKGHETMTFDELAQSSQGVSRWGVLRMDVDNLGELFHEGFTRDGQNNLTLSRVAGLSSALRLFFEGWLPRLGEQWPHKETDPASQPIRSNSLYVQYTGGDDVFVVGAWDVLPQFAARIRESFRSFVCGNPAVTISAGITLADERFPLYQAAEQAAEAERAAKNFERPDGSGKDAICLFDQAIGWEQLGEVSWRAQLMAGWCDGSGNDGKPLPKSIIQSFLAIDAEFQRGATESKRTRKPRRQGQFYYGPWMWQAAYKLTRTADALERQSPTVAQTIRAWEEQLVDPARNAIVTIGLAARWAELLSR